MFAGSLELQIGVRLALAPEPAQLAAVSAALIDGSRRLPRNGLDPEGPPLDLPAAVQSPGGCGLLFCGHDCAARAWGDWASLLSTRVRSPLERAVAESPYCVPFDIRCEVGPCVWPLYN